MRRGLIDGDTQTWFCIMMTASELPSTCGEGGEDIAEVLTDFLHDFESQ
jgi:hypothetical protein